MMDLNYYGTVFPTKAVVSGMKMRRRGHIVITASQAAMIGIYGFTAYSASKFALRGFAEALDMEVSVWFIMVVMLRLNLFLLPSVLSDTVEKLLVIQDPSRLHIVYFQAGLLKRGIPFGDMAPCHMTSVVLFF